MERAPIGALSMSSSRLDRWPTFTPPPWPDFAPPLTVDTRGSQSYTRQVEDEAKRQKQEIDRRKETIDRRVEAND